MSDRVYFSLLGLAAALLITLSLVWPQGMGARSPGPFGHETATQAAARAARSKPAPTRTVKPKAPGVL